MHLELLLILLQVRNALELSQALLVSGADSPGLRAACARLANAAVAVLGPEFTLGSSYYQARRCSRQRGEVKFAPVFYASVLLLQ